MDDVKDFEKDKIVHPERYFLNKRHHILYIPLLNIRPLPRGLIKYEEVVKVINFTLFFMIIYACILGLRFNWTVAIFFATQVSKRHCPVSAILVRSL